MALQSLRLAERTVRSVVAITARFGYALLTSPIMSARASLASPPVYVGSLFQELTTTIERTPVPWPNQSPRPSGPPGAVRSVRRVMGIAVWFTFSKYGSWATEAHLHTPAKFCSRSRDSLQAATSSLGGEGALWAPVMNR